MEIEPLPLAGLKIIHPAVFEDERGWFFESYNESKFQALGLVIHWVQDNHARSEKNTLRGLHFQHGPGQAKLVRCVRGRVWDVAVDICPDSPTLGQWHGLELNDVNRQMVLIPEGFAHGYCVLSEQAEIIYKCSTVYCAALEREIAWNDPALGVRWPVTRPLLSPRDRQAPSFEHYLEVACLGVR